MNEHTRRRMIIAERVAESYADSSNTQVVMIAGSVGRGRADRYSDIEIDVYYDRPPTEAERIASVEGCGGTVLDLDQDDDEWEEQLSVAGIKAGTSTFLVTTMQRYLDEVLMRCNLAPLAQTRLFSLQHAITVKGDDQVTKWRAQAAGYPDGLLHAMLHENLGFDGFWYAEEMLAARDDLLALYDIFVRVERQIIGALLGLNRIYLPTPQPMKWMDEMIGSMTIAPDALSARLKHAFKVDSVEGIRLLKDVIAEVLDLVDSTVPAFDTGPYRANFGRQRLAWNGPTQSG